MRRVLVTRPDGRELCAKLRALGWEAVAVPTVAIVPVAPGGDLDRVARRLEAYDWIVVTSAHGAQALAAALARTGAPRPTRPRWAAVGPATARALQAAGVQVAVVPARYLTAAVAEALGPVEGLTVLLPRADAASPELPRLLRARGAQVEEVVAYRTVEGPERSRLPLQRALMDGIDAALFTSPSTARGFWRLAPEPHRALAGVLVAAIGPVTAGALRALGRPPDVVAEEHTGDGLVAALAAAASPPVR